MSDPENPIPSPEPTLERDGYEVEYVPLSLQKTFKPPTDHSYIHLGVMQTEGMIDPVQQYLVYNPRVVEPTQYTSQSLKYRELVNEAMRQAGWVLVGASDLNTHVTAVRRINEEPLDSTQSQAETTPSPTEPTF